LLGRGHADQTSGGQGAAQRDAGERSHRLAAGRGLSQRSRPTVELAIVHEPTFPIGSRSTLAMRSGGASAAGTGESCHVTASLPSVDERKSAAGGRSRLRRLA
jgi:hypothetical protein